MAKRVVSASIDEALAAKLDGVVADTNREQSYFIQPSAQGAFRGGGGP